MGNSISQCHLCQEPESYHQDACDQMKFQRKIKNYRHLTRKRNELEINRVLQNQNYILISEELKLELLKEDNLSTTSCDT